MFDNVSLAKGEEVERDEREAEKLPGGKGAFSHMRRAFSSGKAQG
jgi:hypothetical protein